MADVMQLLTGDDPKDAKSRGKSSPSFEEDVIDGFPIRSFSGCEETLAFVAVRASEQAAREEQKKREQQERMKRVQQQQLERYHQQQRLAQVEEEKARKRMRRIEDRKYPESEFITEHCMESMVPSPTFDRSVRMKSDSDSDYEPSVAKKRRRVSHSHRNNRRVQSSHHYSSSSSENEGGSYRPTSKQPKLPSPGHGRNHSPVASHHSRHGAAAVAVRPQLQQPPHHIQHHRSPSAPGDGNYTALSRETLDQYQRAMAQNTSTRSSVEARCSSASSEHRPGPPPLRPHGQFAIPHSVVFDKEYPQLKHDEIHWPVLHVSIANRIKQHADILREGQPRRFEAVRDTLKISHVPRPKFPNNGTNGAGTVGGNGASATPTVVVPAAAGAVTALPPSPSRGQSAVSAVPTSSHGSSTAMHVTASAYSTDHHGPPATAPALPSYSSQQAAAEATAAASSPAATAPALPSGKAADLLRLSASRDGQSGSAGSNPTSPRDSAPPTLAKSSQPSGTHGGSNGAGSGRDESASKLRERLEQPVSTVPMSASSPSAPVPVNAVAGASAAGDRSSPGTSGLKVSAAMPSGGSISGSKSAPTASNTLMSVDPKSLVLIDKKPMVGIKTPSGIQYIEVVVRTSSAGNATGKLLVQPTNALSSELMAAITKPLPATATTCGGGTSAKQVVTTVATSVRAVTVPIASKSTVVAASKSAGAVTALSPGASAGGSSNSGSKPNSNPSTPVRILPRPVSSAPTSPAPIAAGSNDGAGRSGASSPRVQTPATVLGPESRTSRPTSRATSPAPPPRARPESKVLSTPQATGLTSAVAPSADGQAQTPLLPTSGTTPSPEVFMVESSGTLTGNAAESMHADTPTLSATATAEKD